MSRAWALAARFKAAERDSGNTPAPTRVRSTSSAIWSSRASISPAAGSSSAAALDVVAPSSAATSHTNSTLIATARLSMSSRRPDLTGPQSGISLTSSRGAKGQRGVGHGEANVSDAGCEALGCYVLPFGHLPDHKVE